MASNRTLRAGAGTILALAGIATSVTLALPMAASASAGTAWFHDPVSAKARHAEIAVPASPDSYTGPLRHTTATFRTHRGSIAVPVARAYGHTLVRGQALSLSKASLFAFNSPIPTHAAKAEIRRLGGALADVRRVTCEGYTDFGGLASHESTLSRQRAKAICALVHRHHGITTTSVGYGGTRPVIVGGTASNRAQNRRVIIDITSSSTTPPKPVAPSAPHLSTATAGDGTATITFTKPAKTGGKAVTGYQVSTDGGKAWTAVTTSGSSPFTVTLTGLTDGTTYPVTVRALNAVGHGTPSNTKHVTPKSAATVPDAPVLSNGVANYYDPGPSYATFDFTSPGDGGSVITGYQLSINDGPWTNLPTGVFTPGDSTTVYTAGSPNHTYAANNYDFTGCPDPETFTYSIRAVNAAGFGPASTAISILFNESEC